MLNINQPSQYGSELDEALVEVYTWKTGKNPHSSLYQKKNTLGPVNYQNLDLDIAPEQIACGEEHVMFVAGEKLFAMGDNSDGRLGISKRQVRSCNVPTLVHALSSFRVLKVACGAKHTIALVEPGDVFAWGSGADGQLGLRNDLTQFSPQYVKLDRTDLYSQVEEPSKAIDISCGLNHTAVVSRNGDIFTFGNGEYGQLGNGKRAPEYIPYKVKLANDRAEKVSCGKYHTIVLSNKGNLYAFGLNSQGQLGVGNRKNCDVPHKVSFPEKVKISKIQAGIHSAAITHLGQMYVWGPCILGDCLTPQRVCKNVELISDVQIAPNMTAVLDFRGRLWTLGSHKPGELGVQSLEARTMGAQVRTLREKKVQSIVCGTRDLAYIVTEKGGQLCNSSYMTARGASLSPTMKDLNASITGRSFFGNDTSRDHGNRSFSTGLIKGTTGILKGWRPTEKALEAFTLSKSSIPTVHTTFQTEGHENVFSSENLLAEFNTRNHEISKERRQEYHDEREKRGVMLPRVRDAALEEIAEHEHSTSAYEYASESERTHKLIMNKNNQQERQLESSARDVRDVRDVRDNRQSRQGGDLMDIVDKRESLREKFSGGANPNAGFEEQSTGSGKNNLGAAFNAKELLQKQLSSGLNGLKTDETVEIERLISYNHLNTHEDQPRDEFVGSRAELKKSSFVADGEQANGKSPNKLGEGDTSREEFTSELEVPLETKKSSQADDKKKKPPKGASNAAKKSSPATTPKSGQNRGRFASEQEAPSSPEMIAQDKSKNKNQSPIQKRPASGKRLSVEKSRPNYLNNKSNEKSQRKSVERKPEETEEERALAYERKVQEQIGHIKNKTSGTKIRSDGKVSINDKLFSDIGKASEQSREAYERKVQAQIRNLKNSSPKRSSTSPKSYSRSSLSPISKKSSPSPSRSVSRQNSDIEYLNTPVHGGKSPAKNNGGGMRNNYTYENEKNTSATIGRENNKSIQRGGDKNNTANLSEDESPIRGGNKRNESYENERGSNQSQNRDISGNFDKEGNPIQIENQRYTSSKDESQGQNRENSGKIDKEGNPICGGNKRNESYENERSSQSHSQGGNFNENIVQGGSPIRGGNKRNESYERRDQNQIDQERIPVGVNGSNKFEIRGESQNQNSEETPIWRDLKNESYERRYQNQTRTNLENSEQQMTPSSVASRNNNKSYERGYQNKDGTLNESRAQEESPTRSKNQRNEFYENERGSNQSQNKDSSENFDKEGNPIHTGNQRYASSKKESQGQNRDNSRNIDKEGSPIRGGDNRKESYENERSYQNQSQDQNRNNSGNVDKEGNPIRGGKKRNESYEKVYQDGNNNEKRVQGGSPLRGGNQRKESYERDSQSQSSGNHNYEKSHQNEGVRTSSPGKAGQGVKGFESMDGVNKVRNLLQQQQQQMQANKKDGELLGSNLSRDGYDIHGNWQLSSVNRDSTRTREFVESYRDNPFEKLDSSNSNNANRLTSRFDNGDNRENTPKGNYAEGLKNSYLSPNGALRSDIKEPISFGDENMGVGSHDVTSLKNIGSGNASQLHQSVRDDDDEDEDIDPRDSVPKPFKKERSMSQKRAQADLMDAMCEDESFDIEVSESFVRTHSNLANRISDSPIPKKLNESRMSDIAMDLKTLRMKNSMIESQIEEKNRQIALLEGKVSEIDTISRINEKKPSIVLSRIDDHGLQFKIGPHDTTIHRPIPTMDISSIPYSFHDDTPPTVTKIDGKIRIDSPTKEGNTDEYSIPSNINEETPPSGGSKQSPNNNNNILAESAAAQENKSLISMVHYLNQQNNQDNYYNAETPKLRGEEPRIGEEPFGMKMTMAQQRFNSPNIMTSGGEDHYQDSENDEALDNTLNLKSFKSSFSSWQVKNFLKEESVKNTAKDKSSTFRTASPLGEFIIAPPPGYKSNKHKGSKSPNKSISKDKSIKMMGEQEEHPASKFRKAGKSSSMSYRPEEEAKEENGGKKLTRNNSSTGISKVKIGQSPANKKTKKKIANLKDSSTASGGSKKGSKSGKLEIKGIFINPDIVKIGESALKGSPRPRASDRSSKKDYEEDEDLGMFLKENAPEEETRTAGIGKKKLVAKFKKNTGNSINKSKIESDDGSRFFTSYEMRSSVNNKTQQSSFISNPPRSQENSPKLKKRAPNSIFSQAKNAKAFINTVENLAKNSVKKSNMTVNESSMFLTDKISRIETKIYEPSETSSPKIPKFEHNFGSPKEGTVSLGSSPTHSRTPSKSKIGALARLLATSNEDGTGKTPKSALHSSTPKHFSDSYDTIGGYLALNKK